LFEIIRTYLIQLVRLFARLIGDSHHSELIPDAALTLTLTRKRYNDIQSQSKNKNCDFIKLRTQNLQHTILVH